MVAPSAGHRPDVPFDQITSVRRGAMSASVRAKLGKVSDPSKPRRIPWMVSSKAVARSMRFACMRPGRHGVDRNPGVLLLLLVDRKLR